MFIYKLNDGVHGRTLEFCINCRLDALFPPIKLGGPYCEKFIFRDALVYNNDKSTSHTVTKSE